MDQASWQTFREVSFLLSCNVFLLSVLNFCLLAWYKYSSLYTYTHSYNTEVIHLLSKWEQTTFRIWSYSVHLRFCFSCNSHLHYININIFNLHFRSNLKYPMQWKTISDKKWWKSKIVFKPLHKTLSLNHTHSRNCVNLCPLNMRLCQRDGSTPSPQDQRVVWLGQIWTRGLWLHYKHNAYHNILVVIQIFLLKNVTALYNFVIHMEGSVLQLLYTNWVRILCSDMPAQCTIPCTVNPH